MYDHICINTNEIMLLYTTKYYLGKQWTTCEVCHFRSEELDSNLMLHYLFQSMSTLNLWSKSSGLYLQIFD